MAAFFSWSRASSRWARSLRRPERRLRPASKSTPAITSPPPVVSRRAEPADGPRYLVEVFGNAYGEDAVVSCGGDHRHAAV